MAHFSDTPGVTRDEVVDLLVASGFTCTHAGEDGSQTWLSPDRTKFLELPGGDASEAIYGDAEIGEPGRCIPLVTSTRVVTGEIALPSPLAVGATHHLPPPAPTGHHELAAAEAPRALPAWQADEVEEGEIVDEPEDRPTVPEAPLSKVGRIPSSRQWTAVALMLLVLAVAVGAKLLGCDPKWAMIGFDMAGLCVVVWMCF